MSWIIQERAMKVLNKKLVKLFMMLVSISVFCESKTEESAQQRLQKTPVNDDLKNFSLDKLSGQKNIVPVVIIGSGPAGLTSGMYTARAKLMTVIFTGKDLGGQLIEASYVENWPGKPKMPGQDLMNDSQKQAQFFGAHLVSAEVKKVNINTWPFEVTLNDGTVIKALTIIIATGGSQKLLDVPGAKEFFGKGVGVCSICDAPFDKGKDVAVVGGGDAAVDRALQLSAFANKVTILVRGPEMTAAGKVQDYLKDSKNITVMYNIEVKKILGDERVTGIEIVDQTAKKESTMPVKSVYFALGFVPRSDLFKGMLEIDKEGYIRLFNRTQETSQKGVFAAGTVEDSHYQKSATATGDGSKAGIDAIEFLQKIGFTPKKAEEFEENFYKPSDLGE